MARRHDDQRPAAIEGNGLDQAAIDLGHGGLGIEHGDVGDAGAADQPVPHLAETGLLALHGGDHAGNRATSASTAVSLAIRRFSDDISARPKSATAEYGIA